MARWSWRDYEKRYGKSDETRTEQGAAPATVEASDETGEAEGTPVADADDAQHVIGDDDAEHDADDEAAEPPKRNRVPETPSAISTRDADAHVARRLREARALFGVSQTELGAIIGVTFQQVQKYERGGNRISPGRLAKISEHFGLPVSFFFEGLPLPGADTPSPIGERARRIAILLEGCDPEVAETVEAVLRTTASAKFLKAASP